MIEICRAEGVGWEEIDPRQQAILIALQLGDVLPRRLHLSDAEKFRGAKMLREEQRHAFLLQHHLLRVFLARWLNCLPEAVLFRQQPFGKLYVADSDLHFNISRSGRHLAFYFGAEPGGVDIEARRSAHEYGDVVATYFHSNERRMQHGDDDFFIIWTRKEALLKTIGSGLRDDLSALDCSLDQVLIDGQSCALASHVAQRAVISLGLLSYQPEQCLYLELDECLSPN